jgi:hypothetical protein
MIVHVSGENCGYSGGESCAKIFLCMVTTMGFLVACMKIYNGVRIEMAGG